MSDGLNKNDDVFGVIFHADRMVSEMVILKSKAIAKLMDDGMDEEEALEYYDYNISGAYGDCSYSCVDDTMSSDEITEMLDNDEDIVNPPFTGRKFEKRDIRKLNSICESDIPDAEKLKQLTDAITKYLND